MFQRHEGLNDSSFCNTARIALHRVLQKILEPTQQIRDKSPGLPCSPKPRRPPHHMIAAVFEELAQVIDACFRGLVLFHGPQRVKGFLTGIFLRHERDSSFQ